jgi:hypothetical protein
MVVNNGGCMSKFSSEYIEKLYFTVGSVLIILTVIRTFDIKILTSFPPFLGIIGLGLIALGVVIRKREK